MTTAEKRLTLNILTELSDANFANVKKYAERILARQRKEAFLKPLNKAELLTKLEHSDKQAKAGKTISAKVVREKERTTYGI